MADLINTLFIVMKAGLPAYELRAEMEAEPSLQDIKAIVCPILNGGDMERVTVLYEGVYTDMFVDEIGAIKGLARNEPATAIYRANHLKRHPGTDPEALPHIYGNAILATRRVWF